MRKSTKETACGCAGCYTAHAGIELYAEAFEAAGALDKLEGFASHFGADFYGLPRNRDTITLVRDAWQVPAQQPLLENDPLIPIAGRRKHRLATRLTFWSCRDEIACAVDGVDAALAGRLRK